MEDRQYVVTLTIMALIWMGFFIWIVTSVTTHYVDKIMEKNEQQVISEQFVEKEDSINIDMSINRFADYNELYSLKTEKKPIPVATIDEYNPMEGDSTFQFNKSSWIVDFKGVKETLHSNYEESDIQLTINELLEKSPGYTEMIDTENYIILTNVCINAKNRVLTLHFKDPSTLGKLTTKYNRKDFYFNDVRILKTPLNPTKIVETPLNLVIAHPQGQETYEFMEGTSTLAFIANHPELFPKIEHVLLFHDISQMTAFDSFFLDSLLSLFPYQPKPTILLGNEPLFQSQSLVCDRVVTIIRDWQREGVGSFFPSLLIVNELRAQAYIYTHFYPDYYHYQQQNLLLLRRKKTRVIENEASVVTTLQSSFPSIQSEVVILSDYLLEDMIVILGNTDILISAYSSTLLYSFFMLPNSAVIEIYPPFWNEEEYGNYVRNVGLFHILLRTNGQVLPVCKKKPNSRECWMKGMRDRNITVSLHDLKVHVLNALTFVKKNKYSQK